MAFKHRDLRQGRTVYLAGDDGAIYRCMIVQGVRMSEHYGADLASDARYCTVSFKVQHPALNKGDAIPLAFVYPADSYHRIMAKSAAWIHRRAPKGAKLVVS